MYDRFWFDAEKALKVLLYVAQHSSDLYTILKILYLADKEHLSKYGRLITGDWHCAMEYGPVGSGAYDIFEYARDNGGQSFGLPVKKVLQVQHQRHVIPLRQANTDFLSDSDIACLDVAVQACKNKSFGELKQLTHDAAYKATQWNDRIALEGIIQTLPNAHLLLEHFAGE